MFNNVVLDVFIGLIFIFLLYSLLASIIQELIAHRMNLRARMLQKAIRKMLEDHASPVGNLWQRSTVYNYFAEIWENIRRFFKPFRDYENFIKRFYDHPSVKYLGEDKSYSKPAYLQPHNFSYTLIQLLRGPAYNGSTHNEADLIKKALDNNVLNVNVETLSHLRNLFADARQDAYHFRNRLEQWFDETMQRTAGWYKRQTQMILIVIGFLLAAIFNVDTIAITKILARDKKIRDQLVEMAINRKDQYGKIIDSVKIKTAKDTTIYVKDSSGQITDTTVHKGMDSAVVSTNATIYQLGNKYFDSTYNALVNDANLTQTILGLTPKVPDSIKIAYEKATGILDQKIKDAKDKKGKAQYKKEKEKLMQNYKDTYLTHPYQKDWWLKVLGWLLTAWAISMDAPFWFDLLNRFVQLRTTGPRVPTSADADKGKGDVSGKTAGGIIIRG